MKPDFRRTMIWLHTYSGLLFGWVIFAIWVTGTLSYYNDEITQWMKPELGSQPPTQQIINASLQELTLRAPNAKQWRIILPNERSNKLNIMWSDSLERRASRHSVTLNSDTLTPIELRETQGGNFFRVFHYTLHLRGYGGRYFAGIAAMFMLVAMFSGIFTHRRFFRDFFTLRFKKTLKAMADLHAIAGVITIPFCFILSFSALAIYISLYVPWSMDHHFENGRSDIDKHISTGLSKVTPANLLAIPINNFDHIEKTVQTIWPEKGAISGISYQYPFDKNGRIVVTRQHQFSLSNKNEQLAFNPHSGKIIEAVEPERVARMVRRILYGLHEAHFASPILRALLFFMGLASTFLIASGLIIWLNKRLEKVKQRHVGHTLVERLNISAIMGLIIAIAGYFYANRLVPIDTVERSAFEINIFLITWLAVTCYAVTRPIKRAWQELLLVAGAGYLLLPLLDVYMDSRWFIQAWNNQNLIYLSVELAMIITGIICLVFYRWIKGKQTHVS
jgi:uncharacterized iron-regulated membrane protein